MIVEVQPKTRANTNLKFTGAKKNPLSDHRSLVRLCLSKVLFREKLCQRRLRCGVCSSHPSGVDERDGSGYVLSDLSVSSK